MDSEVKSIDNNSAKNNWRLNLKWSFSGPPKELNVDLCYLLTRNTNIFIFEFRLHLCF